MLQLRLWTGLEEVFTSTYSSMRLGGTNLAQTFLFQNLGEEMDHLSPIYCTVSSISYRVDIQTCNKLLHLFPDFDCIIFRVYASPSGFSQPFENVYTTKSFIFIYSLKHFIYYSCLLPSLKQNLCLFTTA